MFECICGYPPFCSETHQETLEKVMQYEQVLEYPDTLSDTARDLLEHLLCPEQERFCSLEQFMKHPFFSDIDWKNLRQSKAPIQPIVKSLDDGRNFDDFNEEEEEEEEGEQENNSNKKKIPLFRNEYEDDELEFIGYTYHGFSAIHPRE